MKIVIGVLERQLKFENTYLEKRNFMLANKDHILFDEKLPIVNQEYIKELREAIDVLKNHSAK